MNNRITETGGNWVPVKALAASVISYDTDTAGRSAFVASLTSTTLRTAQSLLPTITYPDLIHLPTWLRETPAARPKAA